LTRSSFKKKATMSLNVNLSVEGSGLQGGNTAEPCSFTISARDASGKAVKLGADPFKVDIVGPNKRNIQSNLTDNNNGTWTVTYQPVDEGHHDVTVSLKSTIKVGINVGTDASKCRVWGPGLEDAVQDNLPTFFNIEARGTDGQPMKQGGDPFQVKIAGPNGDVPAKVTDNGDGTYRVDYAPQDAGKHRIDVTLKDKPVANSPYTVNVREGADHNTSFIEGFQFVIRAKTKNNKSMTRGGENFSVNIAGPQGAVQNKLKDVGDGTYVCNYSLAPDARGKYTFSIQVNSRDIQGSPYSVSY